MKQNENFCIENEYDDIIGINGEDKGAHTVGELKKFLKYLAPRVKGRKREYEDC